MWASRKREGYGSKTGSPRWNFSKAAELAQEYKTHRKVRGRLAQPEKSQQKEFGPKMIEGKMVSLHKDLRRAEECIHEQLKDEHNGEPKRVGISKPSIEVNCTFDVRKPVVCYNCKEEGHLSSSCKKENAIF